MPIFPLQEAPEEVPEQVMRIQIVEDLCLKAGQSAQLVLMFVFTS